MGHFLYHIILYPFSGRISLLSEKIFVHTFGRKKNLPCAILGHTKNGTDGIDAVLIYPNDGRLTLCPVRRRVASKRLRLAPGKPTVSQPSYTGGARLLPSRPLPRATVGKKTTKKRTCRLQVLFLLSFCPLWRTSGFELSVLLALYHS
jgi:hypothetical protein